MPYNPISQDMQIKKDLLGTRKEIILFKKGENTKENSFPPNKEKNNTKALSRITDLVVMLVEIYTFVP